MRLSFIPVVVFFALMACSGTAENEQKDNKKATPQIVFKETSYDFGKVSIGKDVSHTFTFTNEGDAPLKINKVETDCGCTVLEYDKETIKPGETGRIKVIFDTSGFFGNQKKVIRVYSNSAQGVSTLTITAYVG